MRQYIYSTECCSSEISLAAGQSSHVQVARLDKGFVFGQRVKSLITQVERILDNLARRQGKPLGNTDVGELGCLKDLQEDHILRAGILDVVRVGSLNVTNITSYLHISMINIKGLALQLTSEVESAGSAWCREDCDTSASLQEVVPPAYGVNINNDDTMVRRLTRQM